MSQTISRPVTGVNRDRIMLRSAALRIIRTIEEQPKRKLSPENRRGLLKPPPLTAFKRLEPIGFGLSEDDWWVFRPEDCKPDLVWPLDIGIVVDPAYNDEGVTFHYTRTITAKEARGSVTRFGPFMVRMDTAQPYEGELHTAVGIYVWLGGKWTNANANPSWGSNGIRETEYVMGTRDRRQPHMATSIALRQRYEWAVSLGLENSPTIRFATDPTGMKEVFRIRDLPEGRDRRAALMTWVSDHWRQDREDPDLEVYVRKHLRGSVQFTWQGMNAELSPSKYDLDMRDKFIAERQAKSAAGTAKRIKER